MAGVTETNPNSLPSLGRVQEQILVELKIISMLLLEISRSVSPSPDLSGISDNLSDLRRDITILDE